MLDQIRDKRLVPEVVVSGSVDGSSSNATDLIALLMAKTARDLGRGERAGSGSERIWQRGAEIGLNLFQA